MAKFIKPFYGVPNGEIYPVHYNVGDEIPEEFLEVAEKLAAASAATSAVVAARMFHR